MPLGSPLQQDVPYSSVNKIQNGTCLTIDPGETMMVSTKAPTRLFFCTRVLDGFKVPYAVKMRYIGSFIHVRQIEKNKHTENESDHYIYQVCAIYIYSVNYCE